MAFCLLLVWSPFLWCLSQLEAGQTEPFKITLSKFESVYQEHTKKVSGEFAAVQAPQASMLSCSEHARLSVLIVHGMSASAFVSGITGTDCLWLEHKLIK